MLLKIFILNISCILNFLQILKQLYSFHKNKQHKFFLGTVVLNSNDIHIITDFETIKVYNSFEQINKPSVIRYLFKKH